MKKSTFWVLAHLLQFLLLDFWKLKKKTCWLYFASLDPIPFSGELSLGQDHFFQFATTFSLTLKCSPTLTSFTMMFIFANTDIFNHSYFFTHSYIFSQSHSHFFHQLLNQLLLFHLSYFYHPPLHFWDPTGMEEKCFNPWMNEENEEKWLASGENRVAGGCVVN